MTPAIAERNTALYADFLRLRPAHASDRATHQALSLRYGLSHNTIRKLIGQQKKADLPPIKLPPLPDAAGRTKTPLPTIDTYIFTGEMPSAPIPVFTGEWHFNFEECMIAGDFHLPSCKLGYVQRMCQVAERHLSNKRVLLIAGDIHNGDKDSRHAPLVPPISRAQELNLTKALVDYLLGYFDEIYMTPGNHMRKRFLELLDGDLNFSQYTQLITSHPSRLHLSPYDIIHLTSAGEDWTITHQYQYSKRKLVKANELAQKYHTNIICFHQHHTAIGRDDYDRYTVIDCGGFHDQDMMAYTSLVPNTFPRMNNAWVYMRRGTGHLMSHYNSITDWSLWLPDPPDREAQVLPLHPIEQETQDEEQEDAA